MIGFKQDHYKIPLCILSNKKTFNKRCSIKIQEYKSYNLSEKRDYIIGNYTKFTKRVV